MDTIGVAAPPIIYHRRRRPLYSGVGFCGVALVGFILNMIGEWLGLPFALGSAAALIGIGGGLIYYWWRSKDEQAQISAEGITITTARTTTFLPWYNIESVYRSSGWVGMRARAYTFIRRTDGVPWVVTQRLARFVEIERHILQNMTAQLLPAALNAYYDGQKVHFGALTLDRFGLYYEGHTLTWEALYGTFLVSNPTAVVQIYRKDTYIIWHEIPLRNIPNAFIFLALLGYITQREISGAVLFEPPMLPDATPIPPIKPDTPRLTGKATTYIRQIDGFATIAATVIFRLAIPPMIVLILLATAAENRLVTLILLLALSPLWLWLGWMSPKRLWELIYLTRTLWRERFLRIEVYADGLQCILNPRAMLIVRWEEVKQVWHVPIVYMNGIHFHTVIQTHTDAVLELDLRFQNREELSEKVVRYVTRAQTLPAIHTIEKGGDVVIGRFGLNAQGLFDGQNFHPWSALHGVTVNRKDPLRCRIWLRDRTHLLNWETLTTTPNLYLLLALCEHFSSGAGE